MRSKRVQNLIFGVVVTAFFCLALWNGKADGQEKKYPNKPIDVIIHFAAGGPTDVWTRIVVNELEKELGTTLSIQYKPGAGGMIGAAYVTKQKPDGYTLLIGSMSSLVSAPFLEAEEAPYDVLKDFTPIASCIVAPNVIAVQSSSNFKSLDDVVKFAKEKPGVLNCSTAGAGTTAHLVLTVLKMHGVDITPVPAKGGNPATISLLGKHVDLASVMYNAPAPHVKSGELRLLAATDKIAQHPEVPTLRELGYPGTESLGSLQGFLGPAGLPKPIRDQLCGPIQKVLQIPSIKASLEGAGFTVIYMGPDELKKKIADDYATIDKIAKAAKLGKYAK